MILLVIILFQSFLNKLTMLIQMQVKNELDQFHIFQ